MQNDHAQKVCRSVFSLYLGTDRRLLAGRGLADVVAAAVAGGVTVVQLREKECPAGEFFAVGRELHALTRRLGVPLIINDRVDIMLALDAEGVHIGRGDLPLAAARELSRGRLLGYSVNTLEHLRHAESCGVDYVGVGPVFPTSTKTDTAPVLGLDGLRAITALARVPCVAIGGISAANVAAARAAGAAGVCVISAIMGAADPAAAARALNP